jgi:hypothetical protein
MAEARTKVEMWEDRAALAFFWSLFFTFFGAIGVWWLAPGPHSVGGFAGILAILLCAVAAGIAGLLGATATAILYYHAKILSWRGLLAGLLAALFLFFAL